MSKSQAGGFQPEYVTIPYTIFIDPDISHAGKLVYGRLKLYAGKNGKCFPKQSNLAKEVCLQQRQLRSVLSELRGAGLIEWQRTRTSCIYSVFSERQKIASLEPASAPQVGHKTTSESGRELPGTSAENRQSRSAENRRQKRSIENHHQKRSKKKRFSESSGVVDDVDVSEENQSQNRSFQIADDEKPKSAEKVIARELLPNPQAEFRIRLEERHSTFTAFEREDWLRDVTSDLGNSGITFSAFLEFDATKTTNPARLTNPPGHYRKLVKKMAQTRTVTSIESVMELNSRVSRFLNPEPEPQTEPKCPDCKCPLGQGVVLVNGADGKMTIGFCPCATQEFRAKTEAREREREERKRHWNQQVQHAGKRSGNQHGNGPNSEMVQG